MTIPTQVMLKMATIGLTESQAEAVADMLSAVENATKAEAGALIEAGREKARERVARYHERLGLTAAEWRLLRYAVLERDGERCNYCGTSNGPLHVDHVIPLIQGGTNDLNNLVVACRECNCGKSGRTPEEWMAMN